MHRIVITAEVEDASHWEQHFRKNAEIFRKQTSTVMRYSVDENNHVALYTEVKDLDGFFKVFRSGTTAEAMDIDGVRKDTVRVYILDKEVPL